MSIKHDKSPEYPPKKKTIQNSRINKSGDFWDFMLSEDADMTKTKEGRDIIEIIKNLE